MLGTLLRLSLVSCLFLLTACENIHQYWKDTWVDDSAVWANNYNGQHNPDAVVRAPDPKTNIRDRSETNATDTSKMFSNPNVIVYPVSGDPYEQQKQTFPEYRGVMDNTTAGGYTAFDESVTVYSLGQRNAKPSYMPDYAVPKYAQPSTAGEMMPMPTTQQRGPTSLTTMSPRVPSAPNTSREYTPQTNNLPVQSVPSRAGRRSRPVLTAYD